MKTTSGYRTLISLVLLMCLSASCEGPAPEQPQLGPVKKFTVLSESFQAGGELPSRYTCDGADESPSIGWEYRGQDASAFVLTMTDEDANDFVHWLLWGISGEVTNFGEGATPPGAQEGENGFGSTGYRGPCPPEGDGPHHYVFTVYALDRLPDAPDELKLEDALNAIDCCVAGIGSVEATYER